MKVMKSFFLITALLLTGGTIPCQETFDAVKKNDRTKVKQLIEKDPGQIDLTNPQGNAPLHEAPLNSNDEISRLLITQGADIGKQNAMGNPPLHIAGQSNRIAMPCISFKSKAGTWGEAIQLDKFIGNGVCCIVSPDGKYIFNGSFWASANFIEELRQKGSNKEDK